jgi:regulation of enolase protein 1 (concanavalin A-like superfamily)
MRGRSLLLLAIAPLVLSAAPVPKRNDAARLKEIYGTWDDPDKDCAFAFKGDKLGISLPAAWHVLWPSLRGSTNNAPRVLREVEGDFTAVVRVTFPVPKQVPQEFWPFCSGGLVAWESDKRFMILRRSGGDVNGESEAIFLHHNTNDRVGMTVAPVGERGESAYLRLKREGKKIVPSWTRDGKSWKRVSAYDCVWADKIKVGIIAENTLGTPVEITFDQYSLTQPKK